MFKTLITIVFLCAQFSWAGLNISGKVKSADGETTKLAHAHISYLGSSVYRPLQTKEITADGSFSFNLEDGKYYTLFITAADHYGLQIPILYEEDNPNIKIDIQLDAYEFNKDYNDVKVIGDWNNFKFGTASDLTKQNDGTYIYEVKSDADKVGYQLYQLESSGHSINGTNYHELEYDGGGDYKSFVKVENGTAKIVFDPKKLIESKKDLPVVDFGDNQSLSIINEIQKKYSKVNSKNRQHKATNKDGSKFDWSEMDAFLKKHLKNGNSIVKRFISTKYAAMVYNGFETEDLEYILAILPITDPLWELNYYGAYTFLKNTFGKENADKYIDENFNKIESRKVKASLLAMQGLDAKSNDNMELVAQIYNRLESEYKDVTEISYFKSQLDQSKTITKGKPVPDFKVQLIHSEKVVSRESMIGQFYLLDFWAVWCGPCRREMPNMHEVYEDFNSKNFTILSLSFDPKLETVDKYRKEKWAMPWLHTFVEKGKNNELSKRFEVTGIPKPILVNPEGIIIATDMELRGEDLRKTLDKYLNTTM